MEPWTDVNVEWNDAPDFDSGTPDSPDFDSDGGRGFRVIKNEREIDFGVF
ncbi:hypothetical protein DY000_02056960 [Brassica cretica]|uniref:Uncharacterized protein n=1 Tax=Brassica cretica TaxID=69181 RepID=A0ABQ7AEJ1_BRACR|nr:hypothetical protein DY000_02056960 [Brassica cretica]